MVGVVTWRLAMVGVVTWRMAMVGVVTWRLAVVGVVTWRLAMVGVVTWYPVRSRALQLRSQVQLTNRSRARSLSVVFRAWMVMAVFGLLIP